MSELTLQQRFNKLRRLYDLQKDALDDAIAEISRLYTLLGANNIRDEDDLYSISSAEIHVFRRLREIAEVDNMVDEYDADNDWKKLDEDDEIDKCCLIMEANMEEERQRLRDEIKMKNRG